MAQLQFSANLIKKLIIAWREEYFHFREQLCSILAYLGFGVHLASPSTHINLLSKLDEMLFKGVSTKEVITLLLGLLKSGSGLPPNQTKALLREVFGILESNSVATYTAALSLKQPII